jgi:hypothetical protein
MKYLLYYTLLETTETTTLLRVVVFNHRRAVSFHRIPRGETMKRHAWLAGG